MNVAEILQEARTKIAEPGHWTIGAWARTATEHETHPLMPDACAWCIGGAVWAAAGGDPDKQDRPDDDPVYKAIALLTRLAGVSPLADFNDALTTNHADVLALFDKAIVEAKTWQVGS